MLKIGMNGFGRFGLHLLKYWLDRNHESKFAIQYISDDTLSLQDAYRIITTDPAVNFSKYKVKAENNQLLFTEVDGTRHVIGYSKASKSEIPWVNASDGPSVVFDCSGKNTVAKDCAFYFSSKAPKNRLVLISATSWDAEKTLVYGHNHQDFTTGLRTVSYGSCTVNAYVPLARYIDQKYGVVDSDVNVIHNIQEYRIKGNHTLLRKFCTLEKSGPNLLPFLQKDNFIVNYTVIPYPGVSMLDFRFKLKKETTLQAIVEDLETSFLKGELKSLYHFDEKDIGPEVYNCTTYSAVFIKENAKLLKDNLYLHGYFDNENSVNRFFDLANYIAQKNS